MLYIMRVLVVKHIISVFFVVLIPYVMIDYYERTEIKCAKGF
jgi:hypothetical protein